jgi:hypothetical protein
VDQVENNSELAGMARALEDASANLSSTSVTEPGLKQLSKLANQLGISDYTGRIVYAGRSRSGVASVQFNTEKGRGYPSDWPAWAYELAKAALLRNKRVWVFAKGDPIGSNLIRVLLLAD